MAPKVPRSSPILRPQVESRRCCSGHPIRQNSSLTIPKMRLYQATKPTISSLAICRRTRRNTPSKSVRHPSEHGQIGQIRVRSLIYGFEIGRRSHFRNRENHRHNLSFACFGENHPTKSVKWRCFDGIWCENHPIKSVMLGDEPSTPSKSVKWPETGHLGAISAYVRITPYNLSGSSCQIPSMAQDARISKKFRPGPFCSQMRSTPPTLSFDQLEEALIGPLPHFLSGHHRRTTAGNTPPIGDFPSNPTIPPIQSRVE